MQIRNVRQIVNFFYKLTIKIDAIIYTVSDKTKARDNT